MPYQEKEKDEDAWKTSSENEVIEEEEVYSKTTNCKVMCAALSACCTVLVSYNLKLQQKANLYEFLNS